MKYTRGKNPGSKKKRVYDINDNFFENYNLINSYYAGFIAADGYIKENKYLSSMISIKDEIIFKNFLHYTDSNYKIAYYKSNGFDVCSLTILSEKICNDLKTNFNIIPKKSLVLEPPSNINKIEFIDAFIVGYIDGDGSISLMKNNTLCIQTMGTKEMLTWIQARFSEILGEELNVIYGDKRHSGNTFSLKISDKRARKIFLHYFSIDLPKLKRKWTCDIYNYCVNFKKYINKNKYIEIFELHKIKKSQKEIAAHFNMTQAAVSWYMKRDFFVELLNGK